MLLNPISRQALRDLVLWVPVGLIPIANALVRLSVYQDSLGETKAGWVSALLDIVFILLYASLIAPPSKMDPSTIGRSTIGLRAAVWTACTTGLHFGLGLLVFAIPATVLVGKYDLVAGEPWLLVTIAIAASPWISAHIRQIVSARRAQLVVLVGPKGAGKSTVGRMIESRFDAHFMDVERIAIRVLRSMGGIIDETYARRAFEEIARAIRAVEREHAAIVIETTGASEETVKFLHRLMARHDVRLIRVRASAETCAERIKTRNQSKQISVSDEVIRTMHARSNALNLPWDIEIDNNDERTIDEIEALLRPHIRIVGVEDKMNGMGGTAIRSMNAGGTA